MAYMKGVYSPYNVAITDTRPTGAIYNEVIVAGGHLDIGVPDSCGYAPGAGDCSVLDNAVAFVFVDEAQPAGCYNGYMQSEAGNSVNAMCWLTAQESPSTPTGSITRSAHLRQRPVHLQRSDDVLVRVWWREVLSQRLREVQRQRRQREACLRVHRAVRDATELASQAPRRLRPCDADDAQPRRDGDRAGGWQQQRDDRNPGDGNGELRSAASRRSSCGSTASSGATP